MAKDINKKRKQDLGIFYTPQEVVDFIFDILNIWKNKEDKDTHRWQTRKPKAHYPSVIDPACGEGVFLKTAVTSGFTGYHPTEKTPYVFGVDMDGDVVKRWEEISILNDLFKGKKEKMLDHFHQQDGLLQLPDKVFNYKTGGLKEFDAVVGNPPYGGIGFSSLKEKSTKESIEILEHLRKYEVLVYKKKKIPDKNQEGLFGTIMFGTTLLGGGNNYPSVKEVESLPIEILFVDRFIQLAKPGGWIAVIIPDGILTNSNAHYVRDFISNRTKIEAIVSLPRDTFKNVGTNAKTSILFLRKLKKDEKTEESYPVFLASINKIGKDQFDSIVKSYEKIYNSRRNNMNNSNNIQVTSDQNKNETVMVRVDKTLKQLMEEKPASRWSPDYWKPVYEHNLSILRNSKYDLKPLGDYIIDGIDGITYGQVGAREFSSKGTVQYLQVINITPIGIDTVVRDDKVEENSNNDPPRSRLKVNDLLFVNQGVGSLGKTTIFLRDGKFNISQHIDVIRLKDISPFYVCVYLQTRFGNLQIERFNSGVSGQINITFDQIKSIVIPVIPEVVQKNIELNYKNMASHQLNVELKINRNTNKYAENVKSVQKMLKNLIKKTEEVIEGKREDVN